MSRMPLARRFTKAVLGVYMRWYHGLTLEGTENIPSGGPLLVLLNHASLLDVPALMVVDPYPHTVTVVKASLLKVPGVVWFLKQWNAIPVERQGRDSSSLRAMPAVLRGGGLLTIPAQRPPTRTR